MDLLFLLAFALFWKSSSTLKCYQCVPVVNFGGEISCAHFDYSDKYIVDCPNSSMCTKRISSLDFNGLTATAFQRGCAKQTMQDDQRKVNNKWVYFHDIREVYQEGCTPDDTYPGRVTETVNCYCRGELCNGSHRTIPYLPLLLAIVAYLVMT